MTQVSMVRKALDPKRRDHADLEIILKHQKKNSEKLWEFRGR